MNNNRILAELLSGEAQQVVGEGHSFPGHQRTLSRPPTTLYFNNNNILNRDEHGGSLSLNNQKVEK